MLAEQAIRDAWSQYWPTVVQSADDAQFEANWEALRQAVLSAGIDAYAQTMQQNYVNNMQKLGL